MFFVVKGTGSVIIIKKNRTDRKNIIKAMKGILVTGIVGASN